MEALLAFYFGWSMGARSGAHGMEELNAALVSLRESDEFAGLVVALRSHAASIMREVAERVEGADGAPMGMPDVLARVYELIRTTTTDSA
ncbi:MAG: hypothetical protein ABI232_11835 [Jatrophihabitantaceae bacterium]